MKKINLLLAHKDAQLSRQLDIVSMNHPRLNVLDEVELEKLKPKDLFKEFDIIPHIVLLRLSYLRNFRKTVEDLKTQYLKLKILVIYGGVNDLNSMGLWSFASDGFICEDEVKTDLYHAIDRTVSKGFYYSESFLESLHNNYNNEFNFKNRFDFKTRLTKREVEILELVCRQMTTQQISEKLFLSPRTVEGHRNNMLLKTGAKNVAGLVIYALKHNLVRVDEMSTN